MSLLLDAVIAKNADGGRSGCGACGTTIAEAEQLSRAQRSRPDVAVPVSKMEEFLKRGDERLKDLVPDAQLVAFGHVGDGNLHYNVVLPADVEDGEFVTTAIYGLVAELGGSFSAEHGVGRLKRRYLQQYRTSSEIELMQTIKKALDPGDILNPGKVI